MIWVGQIKDYIEPFGDYDGLTIFWVAKGEAKNVIYLLVQWEDKFTRQNIGDLKFYYQGKKYEYFRFLNAFDRWEVVPNRDVLMFVECRDKDISSEYELKHCPIHNKWSLVCTK